LNPSVAERNVELDIAVLCSRSREGFETVRHLRRVMDTDRLMELAPHYIAMFISVFVVLTIVQSTVGEVGFWIELAIVVVVVFTYRPVVVRLGLAPDGWK
jgi:hypothetical protein